MDYAFLECKDLNCIFYYGKYEPNYIAPNAFQKISAKKAYVNVSYVEDNFGALSVNKGFEECYGYMPSNNVVITVVVVVVVVIAAVLIVLYVKWRNYRTHQKFDNVLIDDNEIMDENVNQ